MVQEQTLLVTVLKRAQKSTVTETTSQNRAKSATILMWMAHAFVHTFLA